MSLTRVQGKNVHKPDSIQVAYIDFDGFFASVEEAARPALRGQAVGVIPFAGTRATCVIAANKKAKAAGVKTGMSIEEAQGKCPAIRLQPQSPDLYVRAHRKLLLLIEEEVLVDEVCSIDEVCCRLTPSDIADPHDLARRIKGRIRDQLGQYITCSIGFAANRQLAKIASELDKPDGVTVLRPEDLPGRLLGLDLTDIPGIAKNMQTRLIRAGICSVEGLWHSQAKHLRKIWGSVNGERFWYALHGYEIAAEPTRRAMYGHGRVLPPAWRDFESANKAAKLLSIKAARRLRRSGFLARSFGLWLDLREDRWSGETRLEEVNDDWSAVQALSRLWTSACGDLPADAKIKSVHVAFYNLLPEGSRQYDLFDQSGDDERQKWSTLSRMIDGLNGKYARTLVSLGPWTPPPGGYAGGKIAFARIPDPEDFW